MSVDCSCVMVVMCWCRRQGRWCWASVGWRFARHFCAVGQFVGNGFWSNYFFVFSSNWFIFVIVLLFSGRCGWNSCTICSFCWNCCSLVNWCKTMLFFFKKKFKFSSNKSIVGISWKQKTNNRISVGTCRQSWFIAHTVCIRICVFNTSFSTFVCIDL